MRREGRESTTSASLVEWLLERGLLRGPFIFTDYWAGAMRLEGGVREAHVREGLVDPPLFRIGLDRPDLEMPRFRHYLLLFFLGPVLLPFRAFRRTGRYRLSLRSAVGERVLEALEPFHLTLRRADEGRVRVEHRGRTLADEVVDPRLVIGFSSLFLAAYKLPLASLTAILAVAVLAPVLHAAGLLGVVLEYWIPVGFPLLVLVLWAVYRDVLTALLGAAPVLFGRYLVGVLDPGAAHGWWPFFAALAGLFLLYVVADWLFMPRPVPPVLMLYAAEGPGRPYERPEDAPWWLQGSHYWVWRYMMLSPAELNKFWERDWERVELWIRADGPRAGLLEWVVTDAHYRELWMPAERLGGARRVDRHRDAALRQVDAGEPGVWLAEVDANLVFHTPFVRTISFLPDSGDVPVLGLGHLAAALWRSGTRDDPDDHMEALDRAKMRRGSGILDDMPEAIVPLATRHLLALPWTHWRYPLGAQRRRERRVYERSADATPAAAADPVLQIKARERGAAPGSPHGPQRGPRLVRDEEATT